nr:hypothetical protein [Arthrobacter dokdonellae]
MTGLTVATMVAGVVSLITIPLSGRLSDSGGRKRNYYIGIPLAMVTVTVYFLYLLPSQNILLVGCGMVVAIGVAQALMYGVEGALISENYPTAGSLLWVLNCKTDWNAVGRRILTSDCFELGRRV